MRTVGSPSQSSVAPASGPGVLNTACSLASVACSTSAAIIGLSSSVFACSDVDFVELMPFKRKLLPSAIKCLSQQPGLLLQLTRISSESLYSEMHASHACFANFCVRPRRSTPRAKTDESRSVTSQHVMTRHVLFRSTPHGSELWEQY